MSISIIILIVSLFIIFNQDTKMIEPGDGVFLWGVIKILFVLGILCAALIGIFAWFVISH